MKKRGKKRAITLIEIMIVILLIGLIGGALAFNMRGSMDKGRIFKSQQNASRVYDTLMMEVAKGEKSIPQIIKDKTTILHDSLLYKDGEKLLKDGWGQDLEITPNGEDDLIVFSKKAQDLEKSGTTPK